MGSAADILKTFKKRYGDEIGDLNKKVPAPLRVPTGIAEIDIATGGGLPQGRITIIYGGKDTAKSLFVYKCIKTFLDQNQSMKAALIDLEGNYDSKFGQAIGIDESRLVLLLPEYGEAAADMIVQLILEAHDIGFIGLDSLAQLVPIMEIEKSAEESVVARTGLLATRMCRAIQSAFTRVKKQNHCPTVLLINQTRTKIGVTHGNPVTMPGGSAITYYASMILHTYGGKEIVEADIDKTKPSKKDCNLTIEKKKGAIVAKKAEYVLTLIPHKGLRVGDSCESWKVVNGYLQQLGLHGKTDGKSAKDKGWFILDQKFRTQKDCREYYWKHQREINQRVIDHLMDNPEDV